MSKDRKSKKRPLFDPDEISTLISQAIERDLGNSIHEYENPYDPLAYAKYRQVTEILKKYCSPLQDISRLENETFKNFERINSHMGVINAKLELELPWSLTRIQTSTNVVDKIHLRARALMHEVLSPLDYEEWFAECKNSAGATVGVGYSDTSQEAKFSFPMSVTEDCEPLWHDYRIFNKQLDIAIQYWNAFNPIGEPVNVVRGSRASTVDKTTEKRRFICVEPTLNMFFQQGLMHCLYRRMRLFGLDVESLPEYNRWLAYESSITCRNATIDWSSASDCVSIVLLRWLLPSQWYERVIMTRSPEILLKDHWVVPNMISTMGNAVTFPLETLVFWTYAHAIHQTLTEPRNNSMFKVFEHRPRSISVFGDDCVVPDWMADIYIAILQEVGFIVNSEKSCSGPRRFRESCGEDYLAGFDVRPYFLKAPQSTRMSSLEPWLHIMMNRLINKYISIFGPLTYVYDKELWRTFSKLYRRYNLKLKVVPSFLPEDAGVHLDDLARFVRNYRFKLSPIARSHHGTVSFQYTRFVYRERHHRSEDLRYTLWLQRPSVDLRKAIGPIDDDITSRRKGGYVVAKGLSCHWQVPEINTPAQKLRRPNRKHKGK